MMLMSPAISDQRLAQALGWVVSLAVPLLDTTAQTDPLRLKRRELGSSGTSAVNRTLDRAAARVQATMLPGTEQWHAAPVSERCRWWANRVGAVGSAIASAPGVFGVLADRFPVQDVFGFATQAVVLCAVGREHGVTDRSELVRMLAEVLCERRLDKTVLAAPVGPTPFRTGGGGKATRVLPNSRKLVSGLWRIARVARSITVELEKRPHGRSAFRLLGKIPVVGAVGDYFYEVGGVSRAVAAGERWLASDGPNAQRGLRGRFKGILRGR